MRLRFNSSTTFRALIVLALALVAIPAAAESWFTFDQGELTRPTGYREWVYVGTPVTPNELNNGKAAFPEFHNGRMMS